jgi:hypothetical protein
MVLADTRRPVVLAPNSNVSGEPPSLPLQSLQGLRPATSHHAMESKHGPRIGRMRHMLAVADLGGAVEGPLERRASALALCLPF